MEQRLLWFGARAVVDFPSGRQTQTSIATTVLGYMAKAMIS